MYLLFSFLFQSYGDHRDLHSFPTRRSSDLYYPWYGTPARDGAYQHWTQAGHVPPDDIASNRSEEHTSELQSHSDLVCRLLLEKKNTSCRCFTPTTTATCRKRWSWRGRI